MFPSRPGFRNESKSVFEWWYAGPVLALDLIYLALFFHSGILMLFPVGFFSLGWQLSCVGLTGGIATGKSTASMFLREKLAYTVIDADAIARRIVSRSGRAFRKIVEAFGEEVIDKESGELDRRVLGDIVFRDANQRRRLERITHPLILRQICAGVVWNRIRGRRVVIDVPLLFENMKSPILYLMCSETVLVDIDEDEQLRRLMSRNVDLSLREARNRLSSQMSREQKHKFADYVIDNSGSIEQLWSRVVEVLS